MEFKTEHSELYILVEHPLQSMSVGEIQGLESQAGPVAGTTKTMASCMTFVVLANFVCQSKCESFVADSLRAHLSEDVHELHEMHHPVYS